MRVNVAAPPDRTPGHRPNFRAHGPNGNSNRDARGEAEQEELHFASGILPRMVGEGPRARTRRILVSCLVLALAAAGILQARRLIFGERSVLIHVRWAPETGAVTRSEREAAYALTGGNPLGGRTWGYYLADTSRENLRALVQDSAIEVTDAVDRTGSRFETDAPRGPYARGPDWLAEALNGLVVLFATLAVLALTTAILGWLWLPARLRSPHATLSSLFADPRRAGPALAGTAARWVSPASASAGGHRLVAAVFVTGCALRVILSFVNQQANDDHMWIIRTIAFEDRVPGLKDDWQGYQPKLYHWTVAWLLRLTPPWIPESGDIQIRIANLVNCAAAIALLLVARSWLRRSSLPTATVLMTFGLLVLNPRLVGIGSQATNDMFVILFGTLSLFWGVRFFDAMSWRALFGMSGFAALAVLSKGNGLVVLLAHACVFAAVLVRRTSHTAWPRVRLATAALLFVGVVISSAAAFGPYLDNYRDAGSPFAQNMKAPPLPHFFEETTAYRPGIRSVASGIMTFRLGDMLREPSLVNRTLHDLDDPTNYAASGYPLHQTSLWSQLYGRLHFVHFDGWPPTWRSDSAIVRWIGRAALVLGLAPTAVLLIGLVREGRRSLVVLAGRAPSVPAAGALLLTVAAFGSLGFSIVYALTMRDFGIMKTIYLFPCILGFAWCFAQGCEWLRARTAPARPAMPAWFTGNVIALCAVYFLDIVALIAGLLRA